MNGHTSQLENRRSLLYEQLADLFRSWVAESVPGSRFPSVRKLAQTTGVAIGTVRSAVNLLVEEGVLKTRPGAGIFVAELAQHRILRIKKSFGRLSNVESPRLDKQVTKGVTGTHISQWAEKLTQVFNENHFHACYDDPVAIDFRAGQSINELYGEHGWLQALQQSSRDIHNLVQDRDPQGNVRLREHIAKWLTTHKGLVVDASNVIIVNGAQQARTIIARLFIETGTRVALEEPGSIFARNLFATYGAELIPVSVDGSGLVINELTNTRNVSVLYAMPSAQFPTGAVLSASRSRAVAEWAEKQGVLVVEDGNNGELTYESRMNPALQSLIPGQTIFVGSLSQLLMPSWRVGYMVVPEYMRLAVVRVKEVIGGLTSPVIQHLIAELFRTGYFYKHLSKMQTLCTERRQYFHRKWQDLFGLSCPLTPVKAGFNQAIWLPSHVDDIEVFHRCFNEGVGVLPLSPHFLLKPKSPGLILNFSSSTPREMDNGLWKIRKIVSGFDG